jgi:hypothetical protein
MGHELEPPVRRHRRDGHRLGLDLSTSTPAGIPSRRHAVQGHRSHLDDRRSQKLGHGLLPAFGQWLDPRLPRCRTPRSLRLAGRIELMASSVITVDMVYNKGENLNVRPRDQHAAVGQPTGPRRLAFTGINPNASGRARHQRGPQRLLGR